jgi:hypothetical protein
MKKLIPLFSIVLMAACNQVPQSASQASTAPAVAQPDTTGIAAYQAWKAQNELTPVVQPPVQAAPKPIVKTVYVTQKAKPAPIKNSPAPTSSSSNDDVAAAGSGTATSDSQGEAKSTEKKGISKAAKGAVIGGVAGAAGGAILTKKNRVLGAVIGGVVGAAGGYGVGRQMDKKDGRIDYTLIQK